MENRYDITIIGSGPGGYKAAVLGALRGKKVAIVEQATWGGCCLNRGCVPKKDWHHTAQLIAASRDFRERGINGALQADLAQAWQHQQKVVSTVRDSYLSYLKRLGVQRVEGRGSLVDARTVGVSGGVDTALTSDYIIIATGGTANIPDGFEPVPQRILTTDMLFDDPVPPGKRVAIVGGGVIGTEFAFILSQFDLEIFWLLGKQPLQRSDFSRQALGALRSELEKIPNLHLMNDSRPRSAKATETGVEIALANGELSVDWLVLGTGRKPNTGSIGLENVGVKTDSSGFIECNEFLQTQQPNIYAIGDCASPRMTANQALADAHTAISNIVDGNKAMTSPDWVPQAIYSALEMARIGITEDAAEDEGLEPAIGFAAFETSPRALGQDDTRGFVRIIGDMDSGRFLGGEIVGAEAGELIHLLSSADDHATALRKFASAPVNHPARAEELLNATETMASKWGLADFIFKA